MSPPFNETTLTAVADQFYHYAGYPLIILGTLANIICIAVLIRPKMRTKRIGFYLLALAVNDIFVLNVSFMILWLDKTHNIRLIEFDPFLCKLLPFLDTFFLQMSSWIVVAVSMERMMVVCKPIHFRDPGKFHRPIVLVSITITIAILNSSILFYGDVDTFCYMWNNGMYAPIEGFLFFLIFWLLPLMFLLVSSGVILCKLQEATLIDTPQNTKNARRKSLVHKHNVHLLLFINGMFIVSICPLVICLILLNTLDLDNLSSYSKQSLYATLVFSNVFVFMNNASNFVPYMLMSSDFRKELKEVLRLRKPLPPRKSSMATIYR